MSTPVSSINICRDVRLTNDYLHTIWFESLTKQGEYFAGKVAKTFSAYSYLRKSWSIKVDATMEEARTWTYLYFKNGSNRKTYYYFINNIEYINDNTVELSLELDVMQTYMFDYTLHPCFVEREHSSIDGIGANVVDEGLELGELRVVEEDFQFLQDLCILVQATYNPINTTETYTDTVLASKLDGVFGGLGIYAINLSDWTAWGTKLKLLDEYGKSDGIVTMWMYPKSLVTLHKDSTWDDGEVCKPVTGFADIYKEVGRNNVLSGAYTPRNNKLYCYPYNFLYVTNNSGAAATYKYEQFGDPSACNFRVVGSVSPEGMAKIYPLNYKGVTHHYEEGITVSNFPTCSWNQDTYKLWLAQNQHQQELALATGGLKIAAGVVGLGLSAGLGTAVSGGSIVSGLTDITNIMAQRADKEIQPAQAKGQSSGSINVAAGFQGYTFQKKSITPQYARMIDDYFDMYGYKTLRTKVPNRNVRENYTYTKTIGCHVSGNLCTEDLLKIQSIYDKGVTHWKNGDMIGQYGVSNNTLV